MENNASAAEISVIGGIIAFPQDTKTAFDLLRPEMFSNDWLRNTFIACAQLNHEGKNPDITLVESKIGKNHREALINCVERMPCLSGFKDYCAVVFEDWRKREITYATRLLSENNLPSDQAIDALQNILTKQQAISKTLKDDTTVDFWGGVMRYMDSLVIPSSGIKTNWFKFDACTGGLQRKSFYLISARSGKGKTDFALALATNIAAHHKVCYFSMEMPVEQLMERVISRLARIDATKLRDKQINDIEMQRIANATMLHKEKVHMDIDEKQRLSIADLEAKIINQHPDIVFVDHVGLMKHLPTKQIWEGVADTSQRLKELAMKYNIAIVALVQENRDGGNGSPKMENMKGSDNLTNDADGIFQIHIDNPPEFISGDAWIDAQIHVTKNRHGGLGKLLFRWQPQFHDWRAAGT